MLLGNRLHRPVFSSVNRLVSVSWKRGPSASLASAASSETMSVQKAVLFYENGPAAVLKVVHDFSVPVRQPGEVMVRIISASVNPVDIKVRRGGGYVTKNFPKVPGGDLAGTVQEADADSKFSAGDKVFAMTDTFKGALSYGTYLQYFPVKEEWLARVPDNLPIDQAGGVPLAALTAWQALKPKTITPGQRVLVLAGAGGVGHFGVQYAKAVGAHVVGIAGPDNQEFLKELGADEVFNYRTSTIADAAVNGKFDIVLDLVGGDESRQAYEQLKADGRFAHVYNTGRTDDAWLQKVLTLSDEGKGPLTTKTIVQPNGQDLAEIAELIQHGKVKLVVNRTFPLEEAAQAHEILEKGSGNRGKIVLTVQDP